ncbi:MAG: hypothetical protein K2X35_06385 [Bryobacteraceae bacterium]|nr:hypothetical protein [Bryobacteraceae bacterium]
MSLGILVHGSNHHIVRGPLPDAAAARELVKRWEFVQDLTRPAVVPPLWRISTREFRENIEWAVVLANGEPHAAAVETLLAELAFRGVRVHHGPGPFLPLGPGWAGEPWPKSAVS